MSTDLEARLRRGLAPPRTPPVSANAIAAALDAITPPRRRRMRALAQVGLPAITFAVVVALLAVFLPHGGRLQSPAQSGAAASPTLAAQREEVLRSLGNLAHATGSDRSLTPVPSSLTLLAEMTMSGRRYSVWRARLRDPAQAAVLFASPLMGVASQAGGPPAPPRGLRAVTSGTMPDKGVREIFGVAPAGTSRVLVLLADGSRSGASFAAGWFVFSQRSTDPRPVGLVALDDSGRTLAINRARIF